MDWQLQLLENPLYFGIIFVVGWIVVSFIFSKITGWSRLAEKYRIYKKPEFKLLRAVQVTWGTPLIAGNIYTLGSTYKGLYLGVLFPFRVGHPPLLIPWRDIKVKKVKRLMSTKIVFEFKNGLSRPIEIGENVAEKLRAGSKGQLSF
jgi:hypothetical protein